ncbi:hypothetical protein LTR78_010033 [Recurvomyces mirabilis]|uniref:Uncharacterized protein n=1 Tax=Recurvomyces mirabilis TaxID=574656 RepID=A0AAE0TMW2_9PEZI|nr:hypothetical protein LTR78_010033 [Recurvomyces mirabilis]KAK5149814.1 hypothetical protein LTS14_010635 [Recurvomyces mirabilis]
MADAGPLATTPSTKPRHFFLAKDHFFIDFSTKGEHAWLLPLHKGRGTVVERILRDYIFDSPMHAFYYAKAVLLIFYKATQQSLDIPPEDALASFVLREKNMLVVSGWLENYVSNPRLVTFTRDWKLIVWGFEEAQRCRRTHAGTYHKRQAIMEHKRLGSGYGLETTRELVEDLVVDGMGRTLWGVALTLVLRKLKLCSEEFAEGMDVDAEAMDESAETME